MKVSRLYIFILTAVLFGACGDDEARNTSETSAESRTTQGPRSLDRGQAASSDTTATAAEIAPSHTNGDSSPVIVFLGNSLSAGLGVEPAQAFPSRIQQRIDSLGWNFRVRNAGLSGDTSSGGLRRVEWLLRERIDVLVLELGGNDGLRGVPIEVVRSNLARIIERTRSTYPDAQIVITGMQIPPNLGQDYTVAFRRMYADLAEEYNTHLVPFLMEGVGGLDDLMQNDGIHPTAEGHRIMAENVWKTLGPILGEMQPKAS